MWVNFGVLAWRTPRLSTVKWGRESCEFHAKPSLKEKAKGLLSALRILLQLSRGRGYLTVPFYAALIRVQCLPMASVITAKAIKCIEFHPLSSAFRKAQLTPWCSRVVWF